MRQSVGRDSVEPVFAFVARESHEWTRMIRIGIIAKLTADASAILFSQLSTINHQLCSGHWSHVTRHFPFYVNRVERHDPDLWSDEFYFLNRPGQAEIQSDLFYDYRTNVDSYPKWQEWMREKQPRLLVIWGNMKRLLTPASRNGIAGMFRMPKSMSLTAGISRWTQLQMKSPLWSEILWPCANRGTSDCQL